MLLSTFFSHANAHIDMNTHTCYMPITILFHHRLKLITIRADVMSDSILSNMFPQGLVHKEKINFFIVKVLYNKKYFIVLHKNKKRALSF